MKPRRSRRPANLDADGQKHCLTCGKEIYQRDCFCSDECAKQYYILEKAGIVKEKKK